MNKRSQNKNADYMTVLKAPKPCYKHVYIGGDGQVVKDGASHITQATATTHYVPDVASVYQLMQKLSEQPNGALVNGYVDGTEGGKPYEIRSVAYIEKKTDQKYTNGWVEVRGEKVIARTKNNFLPSSWRQIDRDRANGLPEELNPDTE